MKGMIKTIMNSEQYMNQSSNYVMDTYGRMPIVICSGKGATVTDVEGKEYIDFTSGIGVSSLGYADREWVKAVKAQAASLAHISNIYYNPQYIELSKKLCSATGYSKVFFCNSGAEANEGAIKLARKYSFDKYGAGRANIITLKNSFHGRTITTLAATGQEVFHKYFEPFTEGFIYADTNNANDVISLMDNTVCAVMMEPVQGEGGVIPLKNDFVKKIYEEARKKDILIIFDEVQTGIGRTGRFLAQEHFGFKGDITSLAKGLAGGLPIGAFICNEKLADTLGKTMHGTTFGGNPVSCAGGNVVLNRVADDIFLNKVEQKGKYIVKKIKAMKSPLIGEIRAKGLMIGIDVNRTDSKTLMNVLSENGLLTLTAKSALRLLPPLTISKKEIDKGLEILNKVLLELKEKFQ